MGNDQRSLVLDAESLISVLLDRPRGRRVAAAMDADLSRCHVSAATYGAAIELVSRDSAHTAQEVADVIEWWVAGGLTIDAVDAELACAAAELRITHTDANDCPALALAVARDAEFATTDDVTRTIAQTLGLAVLELGEPARKRSKR